MLCRGIHPAGLFCALPGWGIRRQRAAAALLSSGFGSRSGFLTLFVFPWDILPSYADVFSGFMSFPAGCCSRMKSLACFLVSIYKQINFLRVSSARFGQVGPSLCGKRERTLRSVLEYLPQSTRVLCGKYSPQLRTARFRIGQGRARACSLRSSSTVLISYKMAIPDFVVSAFAGCFVQSVLLSLSFVCASFCLYLFFS